MSIKVGDHVQYRTTWGELVGEGIVTSLSSGDMMFPIVVLFGDNGEEEHCAIESLEVIA